MKVLYSWLREFLDTELTAEDLLPVFEQVGIEVEDFQDLAAPYRGSVVVGEIVGLEPHPRADRLLVARVATGQETLQLVSGAPNLRTGMKVVVALPGASLPGGRVEVRTFRGVESQGMLLSEAELGLEEESFGIIELPPEARPGDEPFPFLDLNDWLYDLYIMPNRGDLMGVLGIARELAAKLQVPLRIPEPRISEEPWSYEVEIQDPEGCPRYTARILRGVKVWPSPPWLRRRLHLVGLRSINNIVDVTNYVLLELGHPLHAFDLAKLQGGIRVRRAQPGERIVTLDGVERTLTQEVLVIADRERPVALAGVMGAEDTGVTEETTDLLLESALFDPVVTYYSARAVGLDTESSRRFIRGVDPEIPPFSSLRATQLILETAGGTAGRLVDAYPRPLRRRAVETSGARIAEILGIQVSDEDLRHTLPRLGYRVENGERQPLRVIVPTWRRDVLEEPDLAEDYARLIGYEAIPGTVETSGSFLGKGELGYLWLKRYLVALGLVESETVEFTSPQLLRALEAEGRAVRIANPLGAEYSVLRTTLVPGLLQVLSLNLRRGAPGMITFELGKVFLWRSEEELPEEPYRLAVALAGRVPEHWATPERELDYYDLKGILDRLMEDFGLTFTLRERERNFADQYAEVVLDSGVTIGYVAVLNRKTARLFDLKVPTYVMELSVAPFAPTPRPPEIHPYPPVKRDLSLLVPEGVRYQDIVQLFRSTPTRYLRTFWPIDLYQGDPLPPGTRSITLRLVFLNPQGTLSQEDVQADVNALIQAVEARQWKIRGL